MINLWTDSLKCAQGGLQRGTRPGKQRNPDSRSDALVDTPSQRGTMPGGEASRQEAGAAIGSSRQRGTMPGCEVNCSSSGQYDPFVGAVSRHERFVDDITGQPLDPELCRIARKKEIDYFQSKGVWDLRNLQEAWARTGRPPISVRWVEVNKGDDEHPNYRSRLVAREIRMAGGDAIFAPTPPLESLRMVLSYAVTDFPDEPKKVHDPR